ncbi:acetyl-CoA carboxylase biotin carboxyl carrier protein [Rhodopila sp.]|uniref:acetyl-CoA carboxylase biotin carboxyl carrier protein n=1 Tax=Rhodopila sp. TaxID=2480087 RepID=UPI003D0C63E0
MTRIPIDPDAIRALAAVLVETGLSEIEIAEKDSRIRLVRGGVLAAAPMMATATPPTTSPGISPGISPGQSSLVSAVPVPDVASHPGAVTSPMVGVAYLMPEPGAPPFVTLGQAVVAGQTLLLIEAMKTFNQIKAPKAGTVAAILVQNSAPVEYGEVLIILE